MPGKPCGRLPTPGFPPTPGYCGSRKRRLEIRRRHPVDLRIGRYNAAWLLWLSLCFAACANAQRFSFKNYAQDRGLVNVAVNSIAQDSDGYIWAGTQAGLYRYDGTRFSLVGGPRALPSRDIQAVAAAPDGPLWIGTRRCIAIEHGGRLVRVPTPQLEIRWSVSM